jgi:hypothetical protein
VYNCENKIKKKYKNLQRKIKNILSFNIIFYYLLFIISNNK